MKTIDLRSDTVTLLTEEMRSAMYHAEVGDDVYGEDPSVNELERIGAEIMGKEAALFVTSGTMGNQVAVMTHTRAGDEVICEKEAHVYYSEVGGMAYLAGVQARMLQGCSGILREDAVKAAIRGDDIHQPVTTLLCLENTHNRAGGTCYDVETTDRLCALAHRTGVRVHIDGARIFNAAVAQNVKASQLVRNADSVMVCLAKGLCAPVGSLLAGDKDFITKARKFRKMIGGGMRQCGILAAAGSVALTKMVDRLPEDHEHAKKLAMAVAQMGFAIHLDTVQTNIVYFDVAPKADSAADILSQLNSYGIKAGQFGETRIRMVTHYGITSDDIDYTIDKLAKIIKG